MFIEGSVGKEYLSYLQKAGWEIDYAVENPEQAKGKGIELNEAAFADGSVWVRIWIDAGIEEYILPADICEVLESDKKWDVLRQMAESSDSDLSAPAQETLKEMEEKPCLNTTRKQSGTS